MSQSLERQWQGSGSAASTQQCIPFLLLHPFLPQAQPSPSTRPAQHQPSPAQRKPAFPPAGPHNLALFLPPPHLALGICI
ncbi:hypothetical protein E2C01_057922 [Portunus trituberculatus]|uniref:Uncharacterized protein n=1 Tax=Portunus trituberculatus TaxID=210409 RepID=A0A5B7H1T7_PORTR|nr:hypothetical protein [Portunus trituberculatus]